MIMMWAEHCHRLEPMTLLSVQWSPALSFGDRRQIPSLGRDGGWWRDNLSAGQAERKKREGKNPTRLIMSGWGDSNSRPPRPERGTLANCATPRILYYF